MPGGRVSCAPCKVASTVLSMIPFPFETKVVGVSRHQDNVVSVNAGDHVLVKADPSNEFDSNALVVSSNGHRLGTLPKLVARRLIAQGATEMHGVVLERGGQITQGLSIRLDTCASPQPTAVEPARGAEEVRQNVHVRGSGRVLGKLISHDLGTGRVIVQGTSGRVEYSDSLVVLGE